MYPCVCVRAISIFLDFMARRVEIESEKCLSGA